MKPQRNLPFILLFPVIVALAFWSYQNRIYDWDMPKYLGCVYSWETNSLEKVHTQVYDDIKKEASPAEYNDIKGLVQPSLAVQYFEKNTTAFAEQLPYYDIKVIYNILIFFLYKLGFSGPISVLLVSIISYFFSGLVLFYILKIIFPKTIWIGSIVTVLIMLLPPIRNMSETPTPDMLVFLFLLIFFLLVLKKANVWLVFLSLLLIVLTRPDYILLALSYLFGRVIYSFIKHNRRINLVSILQGICLLFVYLFVVNYYDYPGWRAVFYDTFIERRPLMSIQSPDFSVTDYFDILFIKFINFKKVSLAALGMLGLVFFLSKTFWIRLFSVFVFGNLYLKFLFFPDSAVLRFFIGFLILLFLMVLLAFRERYPDWTLAKKA